ncbi:fumarase, class I, mitochondrial [Pelomyxa schiedti]|nr:fumarase, class I, mitochondrial [Pelomyxa schiedti]
MQVGGHRVVVVSRQVLSRLTCECFRRINHLYRASHLKQLREVFNDPGASNNDRFVCLELLHNACLSSEWKLPMCQDTGTAIVMAKKGEYVWTEGAEPDEEALSRGIYDAYTKYNFRYSQNAPLAMCSEKNTRTNLPAQIDISAVKGDTYEFLFMAKGGGSSNKTFLFQETAAILNPSSLLNFVRQNIHKLGTSACPPYHLALVIGGTSPEMNLKTVKLASAHSLDELPTSGSEQGRAFRDLEFESLVLRVCQECGVGAQFGGKYYALDVRVIRLSRHGASCPIGLGVSCSADRQMKAKITAQGIFVEKLETCPSKYLPSDEVQRQVYSALVTPIDLNVPMADIVAQLDKLKPGSRVSLTGSLIVARDLAHAWFMSELSTKGSLPEYLKNHIVYYAGPAKTPEGMASGSFGPTTAGRMDSYLPQLMAHGASLVTLAKGDRSQLVTDCCKQYGGFYLGSIGGPAAKLASECILNVSLVDCGHLGMEAVWKIQVQNFPAFVIVDNKGNNMFSS